MPRFFALLLLAFALLLPSRAQAHCDTMSGPVLGAAQKALESGNVNLVLIWVQPGDEAAVRSSFADALAARKTDGEARQAAERSFFETLVRVHRAGEGAAYEGIKPADTDLGPAVPAADKAVETGSAEQVTRILHAAISKGTDKHLHAVLERKNYDPNDLQAGRDYVRAYVEFTHYVEGLHNAATGPASHHEHSAAAHEHHTAAAAPHAHGPGANHQHASALHAEHASALHAEHGRHHTAHLPWLLAGLLGLVVVGESGFLVWRRKKAAS
jgi:hypothetical protein